MPRSPLRKALLGRLLPLWSRRLWNAAEAVARRVPIARGGRRADELFFRAEWERNHR